MQVIDLTVVKKEKIENHTSKGNQPKWHIEKKWYNMFKRIRALREDNDFTQKQIAEKLNCSQQVYSNYELGQRDIPTDILIKLSKLYNVSADYILELSDNPEIK